LGGQHDGRCDEDDSASRLGHRRYGARESCSIFERRGLAITEEDSRFRYPAGKRLDIDAVGLKELEVKFFTLDLWLRAQDMGVASEGDWSHAAAAYQDHLRRIRPALAPGVLRFVRDACLHDCLLRELEFGGDRRAARLTLLGDDGVGGSRLHVLEYVHVRAFSAVSNPDHSLAGSGGFGDLGYDEMDVAPNGACIHRMLFSSGIEILWEFEDLAYSVIDAPRF